MPISLHPLYRDEPSNRLIGIDRDEGVIRRLRDQFRLVRAEGDRLARIFYTRLFQEYPSVRPMFRTDPSVQQGKLMDSLDVVMTFLDRPTAQADYLREMGVRHAGYGAQPVHYEIVSGLLADAVNEVLGEHADDQTRSDWYDAFRLISDQMLAGSPTTHPPPNPPPNPPHHPPHHPPRKHHTEPPSTAL